MIHKSISNNGRSEDSYGHDSADYGYRGENELTHLSNFMSGCKQRSFDPPCKVYRTVGMNKAVKSGHLTLEPLSRKSSPSPLWASLDCFPQRLLAFRNWKEAIDRRPPELGV